ncbi:MAG: hypothetical protein H6712_33060 [Myxococcales bacterium]|nr:hypothetical protein [Myxococcales bacterium]MCB9718723.1 hypothetical protein [Myxococcales bacterium]
MIRIALCIMGLATWLVLGLGLRAWIGGKAYLRALLGSEALADEALARAVDRSEAAVLLGMDPWSLLLSLSVLVAAALVLGVLLPWDLLLTRLRVSPRARMLAGAGAAAVATGVALRSVHPLLSLPSVPEGPRTVLNYACEAAGYGWVNVIAYLGAVVAGLAFAWLGARARLRADARRAAQAGEDDRPSAEDPAVDEAEGPESREDAEGSADVDETEPRDEDPAVDEAEPSADDGPRPRDETTA